MSAEDLLEKALRSLPDKPSDSAPQAAKKRYSELLSEAVAQAVAQELRRRGLKETRPAPPGEVGLSGAERRIPGGVGAKKVDVTWSTDVAGLMLAVSIKSINFRDARSGNFQKNLTNRRGDMLFEAVTLHRRFPYSVLAGLFLFDKDAESDQTNSRNSTFSNAHRRFKLFSGRDDPAGRDEQYERIYLALHDTTRLGAIARFYLAGSDEPQDLSAIINGLLELVAVRNSDSYEYFNGTLTRLR